MLAESFVCYSLYTYMPNVWNTLYRQLQYNKRAQFSIFGARKKKIRGNNEEIKQKQKVKFHLKEICSFTDSMHSIFFEKIIKCCLSLRTMNNNSKQHCSIENVNETKIL